jgi:hypothetical protein
MLDASRVRLQGGSKSMSFFFLLDALLSCAGCFFFLYLPLILLCRATELFTMLLLPVVLGPTFFFGTTF